jgi:hypothetical protein
VNDNNSGVRVSSHKVPRLIAFQSNCPGWRIPAVGNFLPSEATMERNYMIKSKKRIAGFSALALGIILSTTGLSAVTQASAAPVKIKVWAWYPNMKEVVEIFNATHSDVQVEWTNAGAGGDEYTKLKRVALT